MQSDTKTSTTTFPGVYRDAQIAALEQQLNDGPIVDHTQSHAHNSGLTNARDELEHSLGAAAATHDPAATDAYVPTSAHDNWGR